jgi:cardiolipin synthase (CMP-forming)
MTTANAITLGRLALIPVFIVALESHRRTGVEWERWVALAVFGFASLLDGVDGWVARRFNQQTEVGAFLDPLADKLLVVSALALLTWKESRLVHLPVFLLGFAVLRDSLLALGFLLLRWATGGPRIRPHWLGKVATLTQMAVITWTLAALSASGQLVLALAATALTVASGLWYLGKGLEQARESGKQRRPGPWLKGPGERGRVP